MNLIKTKGFTLIELMIVIAIIGILASIAIPQFAQFRIKAFNSAAQADVKNGATIVEAIYSDVFSYPSHAVARTTSYFSGNGWDDKVRWNASEKVTLGYVGSTSTYGMATKHVAGDRIFTKSRLTQLSHIAGTEGIALTDANVLAAD